MININPKRLKALTSNREQNGNIRQYAVIIEEYFKAHDSIVQVVEVNREPFGIQYCLRIALGTSIESIAKHQKVLAETLGFPNKKVDIEAPIPGRDLVGITLPWVYPFLNIPESDTPEPDNQYIDLLQKAMHNYQHYEQAAGLKVTDKGKSMTDVYLFLKEKFTDKERVPDIRVIASLIEKTYESFGLPIKIVEVDCEPDHYLFKAKPEIEMDAKDIAKHHKDLALALAVRPEWVGLIVPLPGRVLFGVSISRINYFGEIININNTKPQREIKGFLRKIRCKDLLRTSWDYFRMFEQKFRQGGRYALCAKYAKLYHKMKDTQLVDTFNADIGKSESTREKASRMFVLQHEFDRRNIDYSEISDFSGGLSQRSKVRLEGKKILTLPK